ncbi:dinuclear metal center YbgI/SA1388 family protein [Isoptericola jiangsuensis]|uniref:GTP cyclohydrolase 1 type 2 homolog n=1 Tax=Isoptericola jiangsuensis TaxID=548579 RepID=A0A2A9EYF2_9MICO|nr:Nif3-like dinuclear metal center hexameric protein [Isoptericola jiangsuensis]PFG43551.1 dinuclear metal center YbgI/SA1388 family protein [Isoptericola jiangsuensis]
MSTPTLADVVAVLEDLYPPSTAEGWDAVGLVAGDPRREVRRVLLAVDPVEAVVDEALAWGADLVVTHHPLFLQGVHSVAATTFKGSVVHRLLTAGCGLYVAHTNADSAPRGVADALADLVGLVDRTPLVARTDDAERGIGRVGRLETPTTLGEFARHVAGVLPATAQGVRVAGDLDAPVATAAVVGGSGDSLFDAVRGAGVDAYVTADLRHHPASELRERARFEAVDPDRAAAGTPFLVDVAHFASEWPWLAYAAADLSARLPGGTVTTRVSTLVTDPWTTRIGAGDR